MLCMALSRMLHDDSYLRPRKVVLKRITVINFGVNDGGGSGTDCCGIGYSEVYECDNSKI